MTDVTDDTSRATARRLTLRRRRIRLIAAGAALAVGGSVTYGLTFATAAVTCSAGVWKAQYYPNTSFSGDAKRTVCDTTIDEKYGTGDPAGVTLPSNNFGVRWTTSRNFGSGGPFTFKAAVRDGVRVYLDGTRKVDIWKDVSSTQEKTVNVTVPKGTHTIRVDFAAFKGYANVKFAYAPRTSSSVDGVGPLVPTGAKATYTASTGKAKVSWSANVEMDLAGYRVYRRLAGTSSWTRISGSSALTGTSYTDLPPATGAAYEYAVTAVDKAGNASAKTSAQKITTTDGTAPAKPTGLTVTDAADGNKLTWTAVSDAAKYKVHRAASASGTYTAIGTPTAASYSDTSAAEETTYFYKVSALDSANNESAKTSAVSSTRGDHTAPARPGGLSADGTEAGNVLTWTANTDDTAEYEIWVKRGDATVFSLESLALAATYNDVIAEPGQETAYYVVALDEAENISPKSDTVTATRPQPADTTAPATPTGLTATGGKDLQVPLDWDGVTDSDFAAYRVYRDGALLATVTDSSEYLDETAAEGVTYVYKVTAVDTSGNETAASAEVPATTIAWAVRDLTVGKGGYATLQTAVNAASSGQIILVKPGTYSGTVTIPAALTGLTINGGTLDATDTVITGNIGRDDDGTAATATLTNEETATLRAYAAGLTVSNLTVENAYTEGTTYSNQQAVALWAEADKQQYNNVRLLGNQDTLHTSAGRQYFVNSYIAGDTDVIFGDGTAVVDASTIHIVGGRKNGGSMTAAKTAAATTYGILVSGSTITADDTVTQFYLGRPWGADAQVTVRETVIDGSVKTAWRNWSATQLWTDARYSEYLNTGDGSTVDTANRPQLSDTEAKQYTKARYLKGADDWDPTGTLATEDFTAPDQVTAVTATPGASSITVGWVPSAAVDLAGYRVYRDSALVSGSSPLSVASVTYEDTAITADVSYDYTVTAVDTSGNESPVSATASAKVVTPTPTPTTETPTPTPTPTPTETITPVPGADTVVAADGTGNYTTIQAAVDANGGGTSANPYIIQVNPGTYAEKLLINYKNYVQLIGAGGTASDTVISWGDSATMAGGTGKSYSVAIHGTGQRVENLTIENSYVETGASGEQGVALYVTADKARFENVRLIGNQDTLLADTPNYNKTARQYFHDSYIEGDVDFIFGRGTAVFDHTTIHAKSRGSNSNNGYIVAPSTARPNLGFLIIDSTVTSNAPASTFSLGRPWRGWSDNIDSTSTYDSRGQAVFRDTELPAAVRSTGSTNSSGSWTGPWSDMSPLKWTDGRFFEYANTGAGAASDTTYRPQLSESDAAAYEIADYLTGSDGWAPQN